VIDRQDTVRKLPGLLLVSPFRQLAWAKRRVPIFLLFVCFCTFGLFAARPVAAVPAGDARSGFSPVHAGQAQAGGEAIERYGIDITIAPTGDLLVVETIVYDFGSSSRHGIYRDIPVRFSWEPDPDFERVLKIGQISVASSTAPVEIKVSDESNFKRIRIGDENRTITGRHDYKISYRIRGAFLPFPDGDELLWNAFESVLWKARPGPVSVLVRAPSKIVAITCFAGPVYSRQACEQSGFQEGSDTRVAQFSQATFTGGAAFTVGVVLPPGTVSDPGPFLDEKWSLSKAFSFTSATGAGAFLTGLLAFGGLGALFWRGKDRHPGAGQATGQPLGQAMGRSAAAAFSGKFFPADRVGLRTRKEGAVEFRPPDGLRPAQLGVLLDEVANPLDVTATIVELAVRGYLFIEEIPPSGRWFAKTDWKLIRGKSPDDDPPDQALLPYESDLLSALFVSASSSEGEAESILLSELKTTFSTKLATTQSDLYKDAVARGWFTRRPDTVRSRWLLIGLASFVGAAALLGLLIAFTKWALVGVPLVVAAVTLMIGHRWMPSRTGKGRAMLARVLGFERFILTAETERMRFAEEEGIFSAYLPYAIVFGAVEKWAEVFDGLDDAPATRGTDWYRSSYAFRPVIFAQALRGFSDTTSGALIAPPPSSSSSGGGGSFSGGGVGGGGGGSW